MLQYDLRLMLLSFLVLFSATKISFANEEPLTVWHQKEGATQLIHEILSPVAKRHNRELKVIYLSTNELKSALITSVINNNAPDIALIPSDFFGETKSFKPAEIPDSFKDKYGLPAKYWQLTQADSKTVGVPLYVGNQMLLYYNKSLIANPASSIKAIHAQQSLLPEGVGLIGWNYGELYWFIHFMTAFNAYPIAEGKVNLNTDELAKALHYYRGLVDKGFISYKCDYTCAFDQFRAGKFAYSLNGAWAYRGMKDKLGDNLAIAPLPIVEGVQMKSYFSAVSAMYPGRETNKPLSTVDIDVLDALNEFEAQVKMFKNFGLVPANEASRERLIKGAGGDYITINKTLKTAIPLPSSAAMSSAWVGMRKGFDYYHGTNVDEKRAAQIMQTVADRELMRLQSR